MACRERVAVMTDRPTFTIKVTPTSNCSDPIKSLRSLLKAALRKWNLRAIECREDAEPSS